jgi:hypothetical protein
MTRGRAQDVTSSKPAMLPMSGPTTPSKNVPKTLTEMFTKVDAIE